MTSTVDPETALAAFMHHMSVEDYLDMVNRMLEGQNLSEDEESEFDPSEERKVIPSSFNDDEPIGR